ncbi:MAG: SCO1664 family protein [Dehalococcoidia bacterium]|nr:SCO1664 family protein [Dehalococcoidia bacterium]
MLAQGRMADYHLVPTGSNYVFYATVSDGAQGQRRVVYKPQSGEAPLWDFPTGTLYLREYAAYLLSEAMGCDFVPPTVIREGVHGIGSVQLFVESDPAANFFTLRDVHREQMLQLCAFDVIANNADRKASHCLLGREGCIWAIDHGITFHSEPKLRTVIWDFAGDRVPEPALKDLSHLMEQFSEPGGLGEQLAPLLSASEVEALCRRAQDLLQNGRFPFPGPRRSVPWPLV